MNYIKFDIQVKTWITHHLDTDDKCGNDSIDRIVYIDNARLAKENEYGTIAVNKLYNTGDVIFLIWAQYKTGAIFGSYDGNYELLEILDNENDITPIIEKWNNKKIFEPLNVINCNKFIVN